jgi:hypothetical protein
MNDLQQMFRYFVFQAEFISLTIQAVESERVYFFSTPTVKKAGMKKQIRDIQVGHQKTKI